MAEGDQRIEVLEDEMKVLKGEVSRTLVDLRALLMREESPLMTGGLLKRVVASADSVPSVTAQANLAPVADPPTSNLPIAAPAQEPSALAGVPTLGSIEIKAAPGAPGGTPIDTASPPSAPSAGDFSPPAGGPEPAAASDSASETERDEERARQRKARLLEEEAQEEEQRAQRARRREQDQADEQADQERRNRKKQQESEEQQADQERRERRRKQEREEDEDREHRNRRRQQEDEEGGSEQARRERNNQREREDGEERERQDRRRQRDKEEDEERERRRQRNQEEDEERERRRQQGREEDEEREHRTQQNREEVGELETRDDDKELETRDEDKELEARVASTKLESDEEPVGQPRRRRARQNREEDEESERRVRRRLDEVDDYRRTSRDARHESEMEEELDHLRRVRRRGGELEDEIERLSTSLAPEDDSEDDWESGMVPLDQETEDDGETLSLDAGGAGSDYTNDDGYWPSASSDQDSEYDLDYAVEAAKEDEIGDGYPARHDDGYIDDRDENFRYPPALGAPGPRPPDNFDSHEYQEEPKINGNNGSRRPRRPGEGRRAYEDSYYEDREGPNQNRGREPQTSPRTQRMSRPVPDGRGEPTGRRPAPDNYGYEPNGENGRWGQPPAGYQGWPSPQEWAPEPAPMDLNLVSSLVRWASLAKHRVGEKRLSDIIELYVESRSATTALKEALNHIASIVDDQPPESGQSAQETLDLIAHLHGILTAALPVPELPKIHSQINFAAGKGKSNGDGNGDW